MEFAEAIAASVIGTIIVTFLLTSIWKKRRFQQRVDAAPTIYVNKLGDLIQTAINEGKGRAIINAKSIVAVRNDFRDSLISISSQLNTEIDELSAIVSSRGDETGFGASFKGKPTKAFSPKSGAGRPIKKLDDDKEEVAPEGDRQESLAWELIQVIYKKWPAKREVIEVELRKILAELGLQKF